MINVIAPINPLGYGVAGLNITKALSTLTDVALWPIGQVQITSKEDHDAILPLVNNTANFKHDAPCIKIWHQHDMAMSVGNGERIGFPIFELDEFNEVEKHHLNSLDRIFVCSQWAKNVVINNIDISPEFVNVIPLGVNTEIFKPVDASSSEKTIFFNCGKWEIRKGHDVLPSIFNSAFEEDDNVELWMMTTNPFLSQEEDEKWKKMYTNTKLGKKIKFIDRVETHEEVYNIMSKADCGIFPSRAEGWNLELLEMLACGKDVITTKYSAHTEFCNTDNAYLVDVDEKEIAYDGKWFSGKCGSWGKLDECHLNIFAEKMKQVHLKAKQQNTKGIKSANELSWQNSALAIKRVIND